MADLATLQARLLDAENALHDLSTGKGVAAVSDQNGERVEYNRASLPMLRTYIAELRWKVGELTGNAIRGGAFRPLF